ncbi:hypothetical protein GCM10010383_72560 [Streptomyces lomondensis]|uniref:Uncharacterized protein n=1 Tax=Streptomyces lomondensis TaxID=68229 RepID=A0ABQ2XS78_9ACTN|nr:hypothetical protein GCM10010383_72560 [Streptomyces lomondensis]
MTTSSPPSKPRLQAGPADLRARHHGPGRRAVTGQGWEYDQIPTRDTDRLGTATVSGPGAGRTETTFALLSDIIAVFQRRHAEDDTRPLDRVLQETHRD